MKNLFFALIAATVGFSFAPGKIRTDEHTHVHYEGTYDSKKGVMHKISCYGFNIGYLTTDAGEKVVVCFDRLDGGEDVNVTCDKLMVEGYFEEIVKESDGGSCTSGKLKILFVEEWGCL
jgi:hypothetical protein